MKKFLGKIKSSKWLSLALKYFESADVGMAGAAVAYYFLLSLFPIVLTIGSVLPFLNLNVSEIMGYFEQILPADIFRRIASIIENLLTNKSSSRLSISLITTLWAASQGIGALQNAMTKVYRVKKAPNLILNRLFGMLVLIASMFLFVASVVFVTFGHRIFDLITNQFEVSKEIIELVSNLVMPLSIFGLFILIVLLNYLLPDVRFPRLKYLIPGSVFTLCGFLVISKVFDIFTQFFGNQMSSYQVIGTVIILMIWLAVIAQILLFGAAINDVYIEKSTGKRPEARQIRKWLKRKVSNEKKES